MAERIQRRRTKGWRMPAGAVFVGRPSRWGNPFRVGGRLSFPYSELAPPVGGAKVVRDHAHAVELFRTYAQITSGYDVWVRQRLAGKDLCCWCPLVDEAGQPVPCHADVLLELANPEVA